MAIPDNFIDDLRQRVDVVDVIGRYVQLKKTGANFSGLCPFHNEKSPSFSVSPSKQFYHCFGCGKSGDAINFLMEHNGMSFLEAVQSLAQQCGLQVPEDRPLDPQARAARDAKKQKRATLTDVLEKTAAAYKAQLKQSDEAIAYCKQRGLSGQIAARFGLGYAPAGWAFLSSVFADYTDPMLEEAGLIVQHEDASALHDNRRYDRFRHRLMFPIRNSKGDCIGFGGRVLDDSKPKYLNSPETPVFSKGRELYGLFEARDGLRQYGYALVTEGYMDVVALAQLGFSNAVATLGTACTADHVQLLFRYTDAIVFSFDGDNAGRRAAHKALIATLPYATDTRNIKFLFLPTEHDPDSYIRAYGAEAFEAMVKSATPLSQFMLQAGAEGCDTDTTEGRARMASQLRPMWQALPEGALRAQLLSEFAQAVHMDAQALLQLWSKQPSTPAAPQYVAPAPEAAPAYSPSPWQAPAAANSYRSKYRKQTPYQPPQPRLRQQPDSCVDHALRLMLLHMAFWERLSPDSHNLLCQQPSPHGDLFRWLDAQFQEYGAMAWGALESTLPHITYGEFAVEKVKAYQALQLNPSEAESVAELRSVLHTLKEERLDSQMAQAAQAGDSARLQQLLEEKKALDARKPKSAIAKS